MTGRRPLAVFDVDGTLIDSRKTMHGAICHGFRYIGREPPPYDETRKVVGLPFKSAMAILGPEFDAAQLEGIAEGYREHFWGVHAEPGFVETLYEGSVDILHRLRREGWKVSMATGKSRRGVETVLDMFGWRELFDSTHCPEEAAGKPDPAMVLAAMRALEAEPSETVMIGDTCHDMQMARAAGVHAQGVAWGFQTVEEVVEGGAHHVAVTWPELNAELDRFAAGVRG